MNLPAAISRISRDKTSVLTKNALPYSKLRGIIKLDLLKQEIKSISIFGSLDPKRYNAKKLSFEIIPVLLSIKTTRIDDFRVYTL